jgi:hypothetical protein
MKSKIIECAGNVFVCGELTQYTGHLWITITTRLEKTALCPTLFAKIYILFFAILDSHNFSSTRQKEKRTFSVKTLEFFCT